MAAGVDAGAIEHTTDNNLMKFRYKNMDVKMLVAEDDFDLNGHKLRAGAFIIPNADSRQARTAAQGTGALGMGRWRTAPTREDASHDPAAHWLRPLLVEARRTKAASGAAPRWTALLCGVPYTRSPPPRN